MSLAYRHGCHRRGHHDQHRRVGSTSTAVDWSPGACGYVSEIVTPCRFPFAFLYRLLRFSFRLPAFLGGGFRFSVISLWRYTSPALLLASLNNAFSPCVLSPFLRCCCWLTTFYFFFCSFPFSMSIWTSFFHLVVFLWVICRLLGFGFCCDSFRIIYTLSIYLDTYVRWSHLLFFVWGTQLVSVIAVCTYYLLFLLVFPPEVIFRSSVMGACPVTTDCIVAMS